MPLVHTCGIFLPPFFCHADWSTPRAAGRFCFRSFRPLRASAEPRQVMAEKREKGPQGDATTCVAPIGAAGIGRVRPRKLFSCQRSKAPRGYSRPRDCRPPDPLFSFFSALRLGRVATISPSHLAERLGAGICRQFTPAEYSWPHLSATRIGQIFVGPLDPTRTFDCVQRTIAFFPLKRTLGPLSALFRTP